MNDIENVIRYTTVSICVFGDIKDGVSQTMTSLSP